ncbi:MAG: type II secretion system minor pseudopilin GspI [Gammaproteobacteria bacterium]|nr:type II secretion system minor pseudopilin GspI [Gammaproteobacteria bacterium]
MNCRLRTACSDGFTLVEVLVAVAILAIGLAALFGQISQSVFTARYLRDSTLAQWVAVDRITELRLENRFPDIDETDGEIDMAGQSWRYTLIISETLWPDLRRIDVSVSFADTPDSIISKATGFVGRPGTGEPLPPVLPPRYTQGELE